MKRFPWRLYKAEGWRCLRCLFRQLNPANGPHCRGCGAARRDM